MFISPALRWLDAKLELAACPNYGIVEVNREEHFWRGLDRVQYYFPQIRLPIFQRLGAGRQLRAV
jgi:hypothetical protein